MNKEELESTVFKIKQEIAAKQKLGQEQVDTIGQEITCLQQKQHLLVGDVNKAISYLEGRLSVFQELLDNVEQEPVMP